MTLRTLNSKKALLILYFFLNMLVAALCWSIYQTTEDVNHAFSSFTDKELETLDHIIRLRLNLNEHERLLYEYYATVDRDKATLRLKAVRGAIENELEFLREKYKKEVDILDETYDRFTKEYKELDLNFTSESIDWDAARDSLFRLTHYAQLSSPVLNRLFHNINHSSELTKNEVKEKLRLMSILVIGSVVLILIVVIAIIYFIRDMISSHDEIKRLAHFPERNPNAVFRISTKGEIEYENPASRRMASGLIDEIQNILPPDLKTWISETLRFKIVSDQCEYSLSGQIFSADLQYLPDLNIFHLYISDITEQKKAEDELRYLAYHDPISTLPNQRSFMDDCEAWVNDDERKNFSVMTIGFYRFEQSARNLGIDAVDELVKRIGQRLLMFIGESKYKLNSKIHLYRSMGVSFLLLIHTERDKGIRDFTDEIANLCHDQLTSESLNVQRREIWLRPVIGASFYPDDATYASQLIGNASAAMSWLANSNKQGYQPVTAEIIRDEQDWNEIEAALRQVLKLNELLLYYQPKISLFDKKLSGMEALVRWNRKDKGLVSPAVFIPVAEESGLIVPIGNWVLDEACRQARLWRDSFAKEFSISVNVSQLQLNQNDFCDVVKNILQKYELEPEVLDLEITESMLMQDPERNLKTLLLLRQLGVGLSLDDFGTGYSSLEYLQHFPITTLKIDRTFIKNMSDQSRNYAVVRTIIDLAHELNLSVVAEGIETDDQLDILSRYQCDEFQGFYFSKPLPAEEFEQWHRNY